MIEAGCRCCGQPDYSWLEASRIDIGALDTIPVAQEFQDRMTAPDQERTCSEVGRVKQKTGALIFQNSVFVWIALATGAVLLIPLIAMQISTDVVWSSTDFIVMGSLIFGMSSLFVLVARKLPSKHRLLAGGIFIVIFLYIWAELAVGVFTNLGS